MKIKKTVVDTRAQPGGRGLHRVRPSLFTSQRTPQPRLNIYSPTVTRRTVCFNVNSVFCRIVYMHFFLVRLSVQTAIISINNIKRLNLLRARTVFSVRQALNRYG